MTGNPTTSRSLPGTEDRERRGGRVGRRLEWGEDKERGDKTKEEQVGEEKRKRGARERRKSRLWERGKRKRERRYGRREGGAGEGRRERNKRCEGGGHENKRCEDGGREGSDGTRSAQITWFGSPSFKLSEYECFKILAGGSMSGNIGDR